MFLSLDILSNIFFIGLLFESLQNEFILEPSSSFKSIFDSDIKEKNFNKICCGPLPISPDWSLENTKSYISSSPILSTKPCSVFQESKAFAISFLHNCLQFSVVLQLLSFNPFK